MSLSSTSRRCENFMERDFNAPPDEQNIKNCVKCSPDHLLPAHLNVRQMELNVFQTNLEKKYTACKIHDKVKYYRMVGIYNTHGRHDKHIHHFGRKT
jgi:hypothetical protein